MFLKETKIKIGGFGVMDKSLSAIIERLLTRGPIISVDKDPLSIKATFMWPLGWSCLTSNMDMVK